MEINIIALLDKYVEYAIIISVSINILVSILGVIPSFFITAANIIFFGFWQGITVSFFGETLGAIITFILYRKGFKNISNKKIDKYPKAKKVIYLKGRKAFLSIFSMRLMPFIPSGIITMLGAIGEISLLSFSISSSIGKIPALLIEGFSVYNIITFTWIGKLILFIFGIVILFLIYYSTISSKDA